MSRELYDRLHGGKSTDAVKPTTGSELYQRLYPEKEPSALEETVRFGAGLATDIAISEGLPILASVGAGTVATPLASIPAYLATRGGAGALGSVARQKIINPEAKVKLGETVSDAVINTIPLLGKGKSIATTITKRGAQGAGIGLAGYGIETALDEEQEFNTEDALIRAGLGSVLGAAPDAIGALRNRNKQTVNAVTNQIVKEKSQLTGGVVSEEQILKTPPTPEDIAKIDIATQQVNKGNITEALTPEEIQVSATTRRQSNITPVEEVIDIQTKDGPIPVTKEVSDVVDLDLDSQTIGESLNSIDLESINKAYDNLGLSLSQRPKKERIAITETYLNAETRGLLETPNQQKMVQSILTGEKTAIDSSEAVALMDYKRKVNNKLEETTVKLNEALDTGNIKDIAVLNTQKNDLERVFQDILDASTGRVSETGRTLNIFGTGLRQELSNFGDVKTTIERNLGEKLSNTETTKLFNQTSRLKTVIKERQRLEAKLPELEREALESELADLLKIKKISNTEALKKIQDGKAILAKLGYQLNDVTNYLPLSVESANGLRKIAEGLIQSGQAKRDAKDLMRKVQQIVPDASEQDIYNSIGRRVKTLKSKQLIKQRGKLKELEVQSSLLAKINELLGKVDNIVKKQKTIYHDSPTIKALKKEILTLSLQANKTIGNSNKLSKVQKDIQELTEMLEGKFRYLERYQGKIKPTEIETKLQQAYNKRKLLQKELKAEDDLFNLKAIEKEAEKFTPRQNKEQINNRTRRLRGEINKLKAKNKEQNKLENFKKQEAFRIGRLEETVALAKRELEQDFRTIPTEGKKKLVSKYEQKLLDELNETALLKKETDRIYQLNEQIRTGDILKEPKTDIEYSNRLEALKSITDLLQRDLTTARRRSPQNIAKVKQTKLDNLNKRLDSYERQLNEGWREYKVKSDELGLANDIDIQAVQEKLQQVQNQMKTQAKIDHLRERLRTKNFVEDTPNVKALEELSTLDLEYVSLKRQLNEAIWDSKHKRLAKAVRNQLKDKESWRDFKKHYGHLGFRDYFDAVFSWSNLPRELMATADVSGLNRQGLWLGNKLFFEDQKAFWNSVGSAFQNAFSPEKFNQLEADLLRDPDYNKMVNSGLHFTEVTQAMDKAEEIFMGSLLDNVPVLGSIYRGSNRHMVTLLNLQRYHVMKNFMNSHPEANPRTLELMSNYINIATGRGDLGKLEGISQELALGFFSPRFAASRFQLLSAPIWHKTKGVLSDNPQEKFARDTVAKESIKDMVRLTGSLMGVLGLASLHPDIDVGLDPEDADFGKILVGNHHIDMFGGMLQTVRFLSDIPQGMLNWVGGEFEVGKPSETTARFLESKSSPMYQIVSEALSNKGWSGKELEDRSEILTKRLYPMVLEDVVETLNGEENMEDSLLSFGLNSVGISDNLY